MISDIHGCYNEFKKLLGKVKYNSVNDQLILLGDYIDRGKDSKKVVEFVKELVEVYGAIALRGNHDQMVQDWIRKPAKLTEWYFRNGGFETIKSYIPTAEEDVWYLDTYVKWANMFWTEFNEHTEFLSSLPYYHEDDKHIYVHAGINPMLQDWKQTSREEFIWIRDEFLDGDHKQNKTVVHGHTPCLHLHDTEDIYFGDKKIGVDGACAYGFQLNCLEISGEGYKTYFVESNKEGIGW
ncbi:metallophosphoesterase family protein [Halalkalibacter oceani]|uniref:metallophosphoesterase family protein n=1 Tax=Halalkalibacter oceani TaxID=1653776 RepID=UPI00339A0849